MITKYFILLMLVSGEVGVHNGDEQEIFIGKVSNCMQSKKIIKKYLTANEQYKKKYMGAICMTEKLFIKSIRSGRKPPIGMMPIPIPKPEIPNLAKEKK